jgi:hypothetical protein
MRRAVTKGIIKIVSSWTKLFLDQDHRDFAGAIYLP